MPSKRKKRDKQVYLRQQNIRRMFTCTYVTMLLISISSTLGGFYYLINHHVDQVIKMSELKGLQIRAVTLAELQQSALETVNSD